MATETRATRIKKFLAMLDGLTPESDPEKKKMTFDVIKDAWAEVGELPEVINTVCRKLKISTEVFSMCVENPSLIYSVENINQYVNDGFLKDYLEYTSVVESPEEFHIWVGLTIISAAVRRNIMLDYGLFKDMCNLYTVLVGPPGVARKTTACNIGINLLQKATDIEIIKNKATGEAIAHAMSKMNRETASDKGTGMIISKNEAQCMIYAPELTVMLGSENYLASLSRFLTDIYDEGGEKWSYRSIAHGKIELRNPYMVMLGCTTPMELPNAVSNTTGEGGLMSRLNIIYKAKTPRSFPIPVSPSDRHKLLREKLVTQLTQISKVVNPNFAFTRDGEEWYSQWYNDTWKKLMESGDISSSYCTRDDVKIRKLGMLLAISEGNYENINSDTLQRAAKILSYSTESIRILLGVGHGGTSTSEAAQKMLDCVYKGGGTITYSTLLKGMYHKRFLSKDVEVILRMLEDAGMVKTFDMKGTRYIRVTGTTDDVMKGASL